jgi:DNA-binding MarR family transcriptional regulator
MFYQFAIYSDRYNRLLAGFYEGAYGLSFSDWRLMAVLGVHPAISASEAGKRTSLAPDKVTRTVDGLVEKGLVLRAPDKKDRRRVVLSLSAKGRRQFQAIDEVRYAIECELLSALDGADVAALEGALREIGAHVQEMMVEGRTWKDIVASQPAPQGAGRRKPGASADS